jgi:hypothetical protein
MLGRSRVPASYCNISLLSSNLRYPLMISSSSHCPGLRVWKDVMVTNVTLEEDTLLEDDGCLKMELSMSLSCGRRGWIVSDGDVVRDETVVGTSMTSGVSKGPGGLGGGGHCVSRGSGGS